MKRLALAVARLIGLATPSQADYQAGQAAYRLGDYATALQEFKPLAERGDARAQASLGFMYLFGRGVPQNHAEAAKWFRKAAEQGFAGAQYNLGFMYDRGDGVPQNYAEALKWYRKAAEQGEAMAQFSLGTMCAVGQSVPEDYVQAHMWIDLSASRFAPGSKRDLTIEARETIATLMTPEQIAEAEKLAREWKPKKGGR